MTRYHATVHSRSSAAETFGYLAALSNTADWDPGVLAGQQLDSGPVGVGTRFRLVVAGGADGSTVGGRRSAAAGAASGARPQLSDPRWRARWRNGP